jgi:hypothetical protein
MQGWRRSIIFERSNKSHHIIHVERGTKDGTPPSYLVKDLVLGGYIEDLLERINVKHKKNMCERGPPCRNPLSCLIGHLETPFEDS